MKLILEHLTLITISEIEMESGTVSPKRRHRPTLSRGNSATIGNPVKKLHLNNLRHRHDEHGLNMQTLEHNPKEVVREVGHVLANKDPHSSTEPSLKGSSNAAPEFEKAKPAKPEDVARTKLERELREQELRSSLQSLQRDAFDSTREVDALYTGLLGKVAEIHSGLRSLKELSEASEKLHESFQSDVKDMEADIDRQISGFGAFEEQQRSVDELEQRVTEKVMAAKDLSERLEAARERVELWERRENEWQAKTSLRLKIGWSLFVVFVLLLVTLLVVQQLSKPARHNADPGALEWVLRNSSAPQFVVDDVAEIVAARKSADTAVSKFPAPQTTAVPQLRIFDEL